MSTTTIETTYHRDHSITLWDVYRQQWTRYYQLPDRIAATLPAAEADRIRRHLGVIVELFGTWEQAEEMHEQIQEDYLGAKLIEWPESLEDGLYRWRCTPRT